MQEFLVSSLSMSVRIFGQSVRVSLARVIEETCIANILSGVLLLYIIPAVVLLRRRQG